MKVQTEERGIQEEQEIHGTRGIKNAHFVVDIIIKFVLHGLVSDHKELLEI